MAPLDSIGVDAPVNPTAARLAGIGRQTAPAKAVEGAVPAASSGRVRQSP